MNDTAQPTAQQRIEALIERLQRNAAIIEHNKRMLRLRVNGQAYRDRLVAARLNLNTE